MGTKEARASAAPFSVHLIHAPLEAITRGDNPDWDRLWKDFLAEVSNDKATAHSVQSLGTAQRIFALTKDIPSRLRIATAESERFYDFGIARYYSRSDGLAQGKGRSSSVDYKYSQSKWKSAKEPWPVKPLKPYDDQLLGQAICAETDGFTRVTIRVNPYNGAVADPVIEEALVDARLREEWLTETEATIDEIERRIREDGPWEKNDGSCHAYNRDCPFIRDCKFGR